MDNVLARVTGMNAPSEILGNFVSSIFIGEEHFFFLNPDGVVFGPGASVSTNGSFHVSTADEVVFDNGDVYSAADFEGEVLSTANPDAFGFLGEGAGEIRVEGFLQVPGGRILTLAGGDVTLDRGLLFAPGGAVRLVVPDSDLVTSIDLGVSDEGPAVFVGLDYPF